MSGRDALLAARGVTDGDGILLSADQPLAELQRRCGGRIPGLIAVPELLDLVRQSRGMGLSLAREFSAYDGDERVSGFVRINPQEEGFEQGCEVLIENWQREAHEIDDGVSEELADAIDHATAEFSARLDPDQRMQAYSADGHDLAELIALIRAEPGKLWTDYIELQGVAHRQPLHWRLLDNVACTIPGSDRDWQARVLPIGSGSANPQGFELLLVAKQPRALSKPAGDGAAASSSMSLIGEALTPALREPVTRIIGNAETIKGRLAGPVREEYSEYAGDIVEAGQHLLSMLDDLTDLQAVESEDFAVDMREVDLVDVARRACAMMSQRAEAKSIELLSPEANAEGSVRADFRRVLQVAINLIGNAVAYSPENSTVSVTIDPEGPSTLRLSVSDQGPGLSEDMQGRIFDKYERLGREGDGGSGLGLFISRKLARAMGGELSVQSVEGAGATFTLTLAKA